MNISTFIRTKAWDLLASISPELNTRRIYRSYYHKSINLKDPKTFDEKIQWLKLNMYGNDPLVRQCADKSAVRQYIAQCGCEEILNEIYGVYDTVEEIPWNSLPKKFVLKMNTGSGYNFICQDKAKLDVDEAKRTLKKWLKESKYFYRRFSEMQYKGIKPKIISERFIESEDGQLPADYKLFCFNGEARYVMLCTKRETGHPEYYFFDRQRQLVRLNKRGLNAPEGFTIDMPKAYDQLFHYADCLSKGFPFVRADFYIENNKIYFGELTFTPCAGFDPNIPYEQNLFIGSLINLPLKK